uniref:Uncharacterized protein n=1 Tax=Lacrimia lanifica TaxID=2016125 RepID=A0A6G5ZTY8_9EUGL|nr:hypothetical protein [Lacrimia lanifica]
MYTLLPHDASIPTTRLAGALSSREHSRGSSYVMCSAVLLHSRTAHLAFFFFFFFFDTLLDVVHAGTTAITTTSMWALHWIACTNASTSSCGVGVTIHVGASIHPSVSTAALPHCYTVWGGKVVLSASCVVTTSFFF